MNYILLIIGIAMLTGGIFSTSYAQSNMTEYQNYQTIKMNALNGPFEYVLKVTQDAANNVTSQ